MHCQLGLITSFVIQSIMAEIVMLVYNTVGMYVYVLCIAHECFYRTLDSAIKLKRVCVK